MYRFLVRRHSFTDDEDAGADVREEQDVDGEHQERAEHLLHDVLHESVLHEDEQELDELQAEEDHVFVLGEDEQADVPKIRIDEIQR